MKRIQISKRHLPASCPLEPQPADPRDRDIVRAKQLVGRSRSPGAASCARDAGPDRGDLYGEDRHA